MKISEADIKTLAEKYQKNAQQKVFCPTLENEVESFDVNVKTEKFFGGISYFVWEEPRCPCYIQGEDIEKPGRCVTTGKNCSLALFLDKGDYI